MTLETTVGSGLRRLVITDTAGPSIDGTVRYVGDINGKPHWAEGPEDNRTRDVFWLDGVWWVQGVQGGELYAMTKTSTATTPSGLTGWTIVSGTPGTAPTVTGGETSGGAAPAPPASILA
jgi:hypothetical protein